MRETKTSPDPKWEQLPTQELDQILQAELEREHPNEEVVLPILRTLEEREKDYPVEKTPEILSLLGKSNEHETPSKHSHNRRGWIAGIAALAAVVCIVVMALPRTVGAESVFDVLFRWTGSIFEFLDPDKTNPNVDDTFRTDHPGLQQLYDKVTELGVTEPVVPMWLPEGFELIDLKTTSIRDGGYKVNAAFKNNDKFVSISYRISTDVMTKFEKEDTGMEMYDCAGISHVIAQNGENLSVTWTIDGVECSMNTDVSKAEAYTIIKSIYRSELSE